MGKVSVVQARWCLPGKMVLGVSGPKPSPKIFKLLDRMSESCLVKTGINVGGAGRGIYSAQFLNGFFSV